MKIKGLIYIFGCILFSNLYSTTSLAYRYGEFSLRGYYSKSNYGPTAYSTTKRYTVSAGVNLSTLTEVELAYSNQDQYYKNAEIVVLNTNEQVLALTVVQTLVPIDWYAQPYVKGGASQNNNRQKSTTNGISNEEVYTKQPMVVVGGGLRLLFTQNFNFRIEIVSYMPWWLKVSQLKNNIAIDGGLSWHY